MRMTRTAKVLPLVATALAALLLLSGCSASSGGSSDSAGSATQAQDAAAGTSEATSDEGDAAVIVSGEMWFTADDPLTAARSAVDIVAAAGGRVDGREETADGTDGQDGDRATLTARVPSEAAEDVTAKLADIATVERSTLTTSEVGTRQRDLTARATSLRTSIARYDAWLATATTPSDLMEIESGLSERQTELETIEAEITTLAGQVAMSTFTLMFSEVVTPADPGAATPQNFGESVAAGWGDFVGALTGLSIVLGRMLPWLVTLALIGAVTWWLVRRGKAGAAS